MLEAAGRCAGPYSRALTPLGLQQLCRCTVGDPRRAALAVQLGGGAVGVELFTVLHDGRAASLSHRASLQVPRRSVLHRPAMLVEKR